MGIFHISDEIRPLVPLYVTMFLEAMGSGLVASIINVVARNDLGCTGTQVGIIWTGFYLAQVVGSIGSGYLSDRIRRKFVLMISLLWAAAGYTMTAFADSFEWFLVSRIFTGFYGGFSSVAIAILSANLPIDRLPTAIGRLGTVMSLGFAIGPLISTAISAIWGVEKVSPYYVRQLYFFVAALVYVVASFCASRMSRQITPEASRFLRESSGGQLTPGLIFVWTSRLFSTCGVTAIYVTQVLLWQDYFSLQRVFVILMTTASGLVVSVVQGLVFPALESRIGFHASLTFGISLIAIANCLIAPFAWTQSFPLHFCCLLLFWTGIGCMEPGTSVAVTRHLKSAHAICGTPSECTKCVPCHVCKGWTIHAGLAMGVTSSMKYVAALAVPALAGFLYDQHGVLMYFFAAGLSALGIVAVSLAWIYYNKQMVRLEGLSGVEIKHSSDKTSNV